jgi:flagellar biosynthesis/type III secretory pathway protein FliH
MVVLRDLSRVKDVREPELFTEARLPMVAPEVRAMGMTAADRWIEQGLQKGLQQGRQEGQVDAQRSVLRRLLAKRFGAISSEAERRIATATIAALESWIERVIDAATIDAVFAG